jgi:hypothetical protein
VVYLLYMQEETALNIEYESLPEFPRDLMQSELVPDNGEVTKTLGLVRKYVQPYERDGRINLSEQEEFYLLQVLPPDTSIFHGCDLAYTGKHWSFNLNTALNFVKSDYNGRVRKHPVLRRMNVGDVLKILQDVNQITNRGLFAESMRNVGPGTTWENLEIDIPRLTKLGFTPRIETYRLPS